MTLDFKAPLVSIVIPIYNEEGILERAVTELQRNLRDFGWTYEVILAENGSKDRTVSIAEALCQSSPEVRLLSVARPNYGKALRLGILAARGEFVICEEVDLCDSEFHQRSMETLNATDADMVIGSKLIDGASDQRPLARHLASLLYTGLLRVLVGFRGTDTHGLKAFRRKPLVPLVQRCLIERDVFASELVIRAHRAGLDVREVRVRTVEKRPPSIDLLRRVPNVLANLCRLTWVIRFPRWSASRAVRKASA